MQTIFRSLALLLLAAPSVKGQSINPTTQITWPRITVSTGVPAQACTSANYGQPYQVTGVTPNQYGSCGTDGWAIRGGSGSGLNQLTGDVTAGPGTGSQAATLAHIPATPLETALAASPFSITTSNCTDFGSVGTSLAIGNISTNGTVNCQRFWSIELAGTGELTGYKSDGTLEIFLQPSDGSALFANGQATISATGLGNFQGVALDGNKATGMANGTASTDGAAFGQLGTKQINTVSSPLLFSGTTLSCPTCNTSSATVTSFSSGALSPLFTTSVATSTTTPALTFALSAAAQNSVFAGPPSGGSGAPSYQLAPTISAVNMFSFPILNQSTTGNAGSATQLAGTPTLCTTGQAPTGILANGNATGCATISGSSGISGLTAGFIPKAGSATTLTANSALDDGVTTAATITSTEPIVAPSYTAVGTTPGSFSLAAGTGSIPTLPASSFGFAAPVTGGTSYLFKPPATITAGILHAAAPGAADGVNESALTSSAVNLASSDVTGLLPVANGGTGTASPGIVAGTNVTVTGTWPNQTINSSGGGGAAFPGTNGVVFNTSTTASRNATSADIIALWTSSCSSTTFLRGDGACAGPSGSGTVTTSGSPTTGFFSLFTGATVIGNSHLDDGITTAVTITSTENIAAPILLASTAVTSPDHLIPANGTATNVANFGSAGPFQSSGSYWTGAAAAVENASFTLNAGTGTNPTYTMALGFTGSSGATAFSAPAIIATGLGSSTSPVCPNGTNNALTTVGCTGGGSSISFPQTVGGTVNSGGIPYFSTGTQMSSSAALPSGDFVLGGGAGSAPTATFSIVPAANGGTGVATCAADTLFGNATGSTAALACSSNPIVNSIGATSIPAQGGFQSAISFTAAGSFWSAATTGASAFVDVAPNVTFGMTTAGLESGLRVHGTFSNSTQTLTGSLTGIKMDTIFGGGSVTTYNGSSLLAGISIIPTINVNTASTTGYTDILISNTETSLGSGLTNYYMNAPNWKVTTAGIETSAQVIQTNGENVVSFSATPTFNAGFLSNTITLTANITSSTLAAGFAGQSMTLTFCQNGTGGFTAVLPTNWHGAFTIGTTASKCSSQTAVYSVNQTAWIATTTGVINE